MSTKIQEHCVHLLPCAVFYPVLDVLGYGLHWKDALVLTWSGIRGCVRPPPCSDSFVANRTIRVWHDKKWAE